MAETTPHTSELSCVETDAGLYVDIIVVPRASRDTIGPLVGERLKVAVKAPPVDGAANAAVVKAMASALGLARSAVTVVGGPSSKRKRLFLAGVTAKQLLALL